MLQYYNVYALRPDILRQMAEQLLTTDTIKTTAQTLDFNSYSNQVLNQYLIRGKLKTLPSQVKKRDVILHRLAQEFEAGKRYSEKRVNEILKAFHPDYTTLRRELVSGKLLANADGYYWRV